MEGDTIHKIVPIIVILSLCYGGLIIGVDGQTTGDSHPITAHGFKFAPPAMMVNESDLIENYTWAIMRYDHLEQSENFGVIHVPNPTHGTILIPTDMMSLEVCHAALSVCRETKKATLNELDEYDTRHMLHTMPAFFNTKDEWHSPSSFNYRKESAVEMEVLGEICLKGNLVGECYAQASFNTAVLRLCGFTPEEVFTVGISGYEHGGHAVNIVKVEEQWYVFDSTYAEFVRTGMRDSLIFEVYFRPPLTDCITFLENDKYLINFGVPFPEHCPHLAYPYSNIASEVLMEIIHDILPLFNDSSLGAPEWGLHGFIENATPCPSMKTTAVPYTVEDAVGGTIQEKAESLVSLNKEFIFNQCEGELPNQYEYSVYGLGLLAVDFPQAYANAAILAAWTSWFASGLDTPLPYFDSLLTSIWIRLNIKNQQIVPSDCIAYADLLYLRHAGSSIDQAVLAYGTLRNMIKGTELWSPDDLYVLITEDNKGYLAVNINENWRYLNFGGGTAISTESPDHITMAFNERELLLEWN